MSEKQRERALNKAHWVREQRKQLKAELKAQAIDPLALLAGNVSEWEEVVREMRLDKLLLLIPGIGEVTMEEILLKLRLRPSLTPQGLTFELRAQLAELTRQALTGDPPYVDPKAPVG